MSFMRWIKSFSLDISIDDLSACEGYPSLQAIQKLERLRADYISGPAKSPVKAAARSDQPIHGGPLGATVVPRPISSISPPVATIASPRTAEPRNDVDEAPVRIRTAG